MKLKEPNYMTSAFWAAPRQPGEKDWWRKLDIKNGIAQGHQLNTYVSFPYSIDEVGSIHIARQGRLHISSSGDNDPDWRRWVSRYLGVKVDLAKEFAGKLYCPHTGKKIAVGRIVDNPVLWVDFEHKVALTSGFVSYETPDGKPFKDVPETYRNTNTKVKYSFPNPKRHDAFVRRMTPVQGEAKLRVSLMANTISRTVQYYDPSRFWDLWLDERVVDIEQAVVLSWGMESCSKYLSKDELERIWQISRALENLSLTHDNTKLRLADHYEADYMEYRDGV